MFNGVAAAAPGEVVAPGVAAAVPGEVAAVPGAFFEDVNDFASRERSL